MRLALPLVGLALWMVGLPTTTARDFEPDDDIDAYGVSDDDTEEDDSLNEGPVTPAPISMYGHALDQFGRQQVTAEMMAAASPAAASPAAASQAAVDAANAKEAAATAKQAAKVATKVAEHSVHITEHAKSALEDAHDALHKARIDSKGLSDDQKESLKTAEAKLKEATKNAEYGQVKNAKYVKADVDNKKLQKMETKMEEVKMSKEDDEIESMQKEIAELRKQLKEKEGDKAKTEAEMKQISEDLEDAKYAKGSKSRDELKAEVEKLRAQIKRMKKMQGSVSYEIPAKEKSKPSHPKPKRHKHKEESEEKVERFKVDLEELKPDEEEDAAKAHSSSEVTPVEDKGIDIDTAMPYGDLEPFGREDTAQELTESSIKESDGMVDQIEKAEVSEEKRSVFRALTRLRGAAITSYDGVARSQTGNIDEYNKVHKWRKTHPMHHLANEEADVTKWAFPDNAD